MSYPKHSYLGQLIQEECHNHSVSMSTLVAAYNGHRVEWINFMDSAVHVDYVDTSDCSGWSG